MKNFIKGFAVWALLLCCDGGMAQPPKLVRAEYYIDSDPGYGKATALALASLPAISVSFDISKLGAGPHVVGMRSQDSIGSWSLDNKWILVKLSQTNNEARAPKLIRTEYYINNDPGYGNATPITLTGGLNQATGSFTLNITGFAYGTTVVGMRTEDANGAWSLDNKWLVIKMRPQETIAPHIVKAEYYIDADSGYGKGVPIGITPAQQIAGLSFIIDLAKVKAGNHKVGMRTMDANGAWSLDNQWDFHGGTALPLTLLSFNANVFKVNEAQLLWTTVSEINTKQFVIMRSTNGTVFDSIGTVAAAGNSTAQLNYSFVDATPFAGTNYYRLKMEDLDGNFTYSGVVPVFIPTASNKPLSVYPNPAIDVVTVTFSSSTVAKYTIQLNDLNGRQVAQVSGVSIPGTNNVQLDVRNYARATYIITLTDEEDGKQSLKLNKF